MTNIPKIIALYLPQFHEIPENNEWWWKWFTEWVTVKNAKKLFSKHNQPRVPYWDNYYDLSNIQTLKNQADLMNKYWVDWLCFYHYWFKWKQVLEKPAEMLLENKDIKMNFCFSWANETWKRTWYWYNKEILLDQEYWEAKDWENHFNYLLNFFKDERYIKVDNSPVLVIYRTYDIDKFEDMMTLFKNKAIENWFNWIHIIETLTLKQKKIKSKLSNWCFFYEPWYNLLWLNNFKSLKRKIIYEIKKYIQKNIHKNNLLLNIYDYISFSKEILKRNLTNITITKEQKINLWYFVNFDDSPRRKELWIIFKNSTPNIFKHYLIKIIEKSIKIESDFIFITAWNEWAEWAYLEADTINWYWYLEKIIEAKNDIIIKANNI